MTPSDIKALMTPDENGVAVIAHIITGNIYILPSGRSLTSNRWCDKCQSEVCELDELAAPYLAQKGGV